MSELDIKNERIKKLDILAAKGVAGYPVQSKKDTAVPEFISQFEHRIADQKKCTIAGRVMALRGQGGILFANIDDGEGRIQIVMQKGEISDELFDLFVNTVDLGDFIEITGEAYLTKRGMQSMMARSWTMLAKALLPLPSEHFGIQDEELSLRERYLSILLDPELKKVFLRRTKFWATIRNFYVSRGFLDVETPVLESTPGGADAKPFGTHHNALDIDVSLRISLELPLKKLLVAGFPKVFEIGRIFRNEGQSREHLQDYTQVESYEAFKDMAYGMKFVRELYQTVVKEVYGQYSFEINNHKVDFAEEWPVINFCALIKKEYGIDPLECTEEAAIQAVRDAKIQVGETLNKTRAIDHLWKAQRKSIAGPAFLTGVPVYMEPLAKRSEEDSRIVERFQVILAGSEMGKGFSELNDPQDQRARFEDQQKLRDAGDDEAQRLDEEYIRAMEYGMPPSFGFGVSERLFSFLENRPAHEAQLFPLLRPKNEGVATPKGTQVAIVVLNSSLLDADWKKLNTTAHLAASFAARAGKSLFFQDTAATKDGIALPLNIQHAIMIKQCDTTGQLAALFDTARKQGMAVVPFTQEMLVTTNDKKVIAATKEILSTDIQYLGVLIFGDRIIAEDITNSFQRHS